MDHVRHDPPAARFVSPAAAVPGGAGTEHLVILPGTVLQTASSVHTDASFQDANGVVFMVLFTLGRLLL